MLTSPLRAELVTVDGITLHVVQWGVDGEHGTPIVCVHGITANAFCFQSFADSLSQHHRVIAYDLRGRGDSDKPERGYSVPIHAQDLAQLIDRLGLERPIVIGHSLGAMIALYFAAHYPDKIRKLVLIDAGLPLPWKTVEEQPAWLTTAINRLGTPVPSFAEYIARLKQAPFLGPYWNEYVDLYYEHDVYHASNGSVSAKCLRAAAIEEGLHFDEAQPEQQWAKVQVPTLLLRAGQGLFFENDQLVPEKYVAVALHKFRDCRYVNFPTLNHYTILFGVEQGPALEIQSFIDKESEETEV